MGLTPLHEAAKRNACRITGTLLEGGASIEEGNAAYSGTSLHEAARSNAIETAEMLISHGARIDAGDSHCKTPLAWAVWRGHRELSELLLRRGARPNPYCDDGEGKTLMHDVAQSERLHDGEAADLLWSPGRR